MFVFESVEERSEREHIHQGVIEVRVNEGEGRRSIRCEDVASVVSDPLSSGRLIRANQGGLTRVETSLLRRQAAPCLDVPYRLQAGEPSACDNKEDQTREGRYS
jgi:hypothetical protein